MAPLSLRIVQDGGVVTRKVKMDPGITVAEATRIVKEKANLPPEAKAYGLFLRSLDSNLSGIWLEDHKKLSDYLLRDGDQLDYMSRIRNLRLRMLDDTVKTFQVDQSKEVGDLMLSICSKIGITNHEEYGLCIDQTEEDEEVKEKVAASSGTLTLKKKSKLEERDIEFAQLSKKLKTDDNVMWIDSHQSLSEAGIAPTQTLLLKRRLFFSDKNVDSRDPVQLNLLYNQARDNILNGRHPVTEGKAVEFAGIQCQIQFGDYNEEKHKSGLIENFNEYLPIQYCGTWGIEKKILKDYSTHVGLNEIEAKHLYTKTARELPTYGVTFFLVKEKMKGKKKLVPRLLGINSECILRLDETTKEVLQSWPLTHLKTYYAGKGETFTLNFGDYTDKEYSVKTRDAFRIRDILEGYIDLIRKRMLAQYHMSQNDHGYVGHDNVKSGTASVMQHISNNPSKPVEHSFVGPSKIEQFQPGQRASHGTQMITAQQMLISEMKNKQEQGVLKAEVSMRSDMGVPFSRRLNRLNSNSVKIVTLLTEPSQAHLEDTRKIVDEMNADMPCIRDGVRDTISKQSSEEERKKLQDQLNQLDELMKTLSQYTDPATTDASEAEDAAKQIATLCTEMYFAIAPEQRRRSRIISKTRQSFIADERTERNLRRASFIAASATTNHALDSALELAEEEYAGPALSPHQIEELERSALDKLAKINAAIAHYTLAHSDPKNIDYSTAVNSLNTIHELMPDLAREAQMLASAKDGKDRSELLADIKQLCAAAKHLCSLSGVEDAEKLQEASSKYGDVAGRLVYVFGKRGGKARADKENEIIDLAEAVVEKTSTLLNSAQSLGRLSAAEPGAKELNDAGAATANAAKQLMAQAVLNAPTIHEPHCQSALTASSEALSSSAQLLAAAWKPLVEHPSRHVMGEKLHNQTMDLAKALDRLRAAYGMLADMQDGSAKGTSKQEVEAQRLQFINSLTKIGGNWKTAEEELNKPLISSVKQSESAEAQSRLSDRVAQLNAAIAALLAATTDRENPDYATAEAAIDTINKLMPEILKDSKTASANQDAESRAALLANIKELCAASKNVCASAYGAEPEALNDAIMQYTDSSGKLTYVINKRANPDRESQVIDVTSSACAQAGVLLSGVQQLSEAVGGDKGEELDARGAKVADAARALFTAAQVTSSSISDPRCQATLLDAVDRVASSASTLEQSWKPLLHEEKHEMRVRAINGAKKQLDAHLDKIRALCQPCEEDVQDAQQTHMEWTPQKLQFITSMQGATEKLAEAHKELNKPAMPAKGSNVEVVEQRLNQGLEQLNAAIAALLSATADDEHPDYTNAQQAADTITRLMPQLIKDTKTVSASKDEGARAAMLAEIKAVCEASEGICASAYGTDTQNKNEAVTKFAAASEKLVFVANPRRKPQKKNEVVELAKSCSNTSALLPTVQSLAGDVGGARGKDLDAQSKRLATAAQGLLQAAQILGPSLQSQQCQEALQSSIANLTTANKQLAGTLATLQDDPKHGPKARQALQELQKMLSDLEALKAACKSPGTQESQEQQKLLFVQTLEASKPKWADIQKELKKPVPPSRGTDVEAVQERLTSRLAALDAALAALLTATSDPDQPSYAEAQKSVKAVTELLPQIIHDTKTVSASKDEGARAAMLAEIKALCEASEGICASAYGADIQSKNDAVAKFANASEKLVFVSNPRRKPQKKNEVVELARAACGDVSAVLPTVQSLADAVGGARGNDLDAQGCKLAMAAQNLLQAAQILSPSLQSQQCQEALLASSANLSSANQQLAALLADLQNDAKHGPKAREALRALEKMKPKLEALDIACKTPGIQESEDQQKLHYIQSLEASKPLWAGIQKELKKPVPPSRGADVEAVQERLTSRLAALDAALASLLSATSDPNHPSYAEAEKSIKTITELLPQIIHDTKTVSASKDEPARAAILAEIKALCEASEGICASAYGADTKSKNDAVAKFAEASEKLVFVANPRRRPQKKNEVVELTRAVCSDTSAVLPTVQSLAGSVGGTKGKDLDEQGTRLAIAAQNSIQAAQILSPSLQSQQCQEAMLSSIANVLEANQQLASSVGTLKDDHKHGAKARETMQVLQSMDSKLQALATACKAPGTQESQEQQKLHFVQTLESSKPKWADIQKELKKPVPPSRETDVIAVQERLSSRLAALDAALAALLAATSDPNQPSYAEAEKSVKTITELLPQIIHDTKTVSASKDEGARVAMLAEIKALCEASEGICASAYGADTKSKNDAVAKFAEASEKLVFVAYPRRRPQKKNEVVELTRAVCSDTSAVLPTVQSLAGSVGGNKGKDLDAQGTRLAIAAQNLIQAAQILSPSLQSQQCQEAMLSSIANVSAANQQLASSVGTLKDDHKHGAKARETMQALQCMDSNLQALATACKAPGTQESQEQQKLHFVQTLEASKPKWADVQNELKKPAPPSRGTDVVAVQERLSSQLAALDAALAALLAATSDSDQPEYAEAEKSVKAITDLLPQIIHDTKTVSASKEEPVRAAMLAEVKALCEASEGICASAYGTDTKGMNEEVAKFSEASSKLVYVANPRLYRQKEKDVLEQAHSTCGNAAALLSGVQRLAESAGVKGQALDAEGGRLADATQNMLRTAQITSAALSAPECRSAMVGSVDRMSETAGSLSHSLTALGSDVKHSSPARELTAMLTQLQKQLDQLMKTCQMPVSEHKEQEKRQFVKTLEATKGKWGDIQKELKKPLPPSRGVDVSETEKRLCSRLAALDAALAALLAATADQDNPSYVEAEKSVKTVSELLPHIIQDTKTVSASKDEGARAAMLAEVKALCEASEGICASSYGTDTKGMNEAVAKFTEASGKLVSKANPQLNRQKEKEVLSQAQTACGSAAALLSGVQRLAESAGGKGQALDAEGGRLADATQNMLRTAQITSTALSVPECRSAMVSSVDRMSETADSLSHSLGALGTDAAHGAQARELTAQLSQLQAQLDRLKKTCIMPDSAPPVCKKPHVVAHAAPYKGPHSKLTQEFLDRLRAEESWGHVPPSPSQASPAVVCKVPKAKPPPPPARKTDDDKLQSAAFVKSLEDAQSNIKTHESSLMKQCRAQTGSGPALSHKVMMQKQEQLQRHLALAGVEVANLVAANYADKIDYTAASKSTKALPQLMNSIVEDGTQLADNLNEMARKAFLYDMLQLCEAGRKICDHANNDRQKMNDAAIHFGDTSTKLLYVVSSDVDPALEKEIISRAKAIGDSASRLALDAANVATAPSAVTSDAVQGICDAGTACVDAAGKLVYTAKLTAPSIHEVGCQDALVASTETLSKKLKTFSDSWAPLESDPQQAKTIAHLSKETVNLERILAGLRSDVKGGNIGRRKELEQLVVEDTPIRQLAVKILDEAKLHAESATLDAKEKIAYAAYADKVNDALRTLDLANARCKKTPHDTEKRRELEGAIQHLQAILLQSRPSRGDKGKTNIVDLMDFMEEVSAEAKNVFNAASSANVPTAQDKLALEEIKDKCNTIESNANKLIRGEVDSDLDFNDLFDQFGQECDVAIRELRSDVRRMEDVKTKKLLESKIMALSESCNMLRFATKSGISTEACCSLDASLDELDDIEARVIRSIVQDATAPGVTLRTKKSPQTGHSQATINLCREVTSCPTGVAPSTVTAYIADAASRTDTTNPDENNKLLKHLYKLVHLLKTLTVTSSKRAATWQTVDSPETARITEQILKEIYNPESGFGSKPEEAKQKILDDDIVKLLIPSAPKILGDNRQQEDRLTQAASQLSSTCGSLSSDTSAATLGRTARVAADKARELDGIARGVHITDPVQKRRIDEAAKEMSFATYNVLKTAESVCLEPKNSNLKRRLADALQNLNHSIDKLVWHSSSSPVLKRQCGALTRSTAAQLAALQPRPHTAAPFNDTCDLMIKQNEQISKLKSDKPMPRKEFMQNLDDIGTAVRTSVECASQCAYYIAISEHHKEIAKSGLVEVPVIQKAIESIQDSCMAIIGSSQIDQAKEQKDDLHKRVSDFATAMDAAQMMVKDADVKRTLMRARSCICDSADDLQHGLDHQNMDNITPKAVNLLEAVNTAHGLIEKCPLVPTVGEMSNETKTKCDEVMNHSKSLLSTTLALLDDVHKAPEEPEMMTWVTFNSNRKKLLDAYDALLKTVRRNGHRVGIYEKAPEEEEKDQPKKSYIEIQVDLANKWLKSSVCKTEVKVIGQQAVRNVVDMARQMSEDLKSPEREEVRSVITETEELLSDCSKKYDHEKNSVLMDRVKELRKSIQRGVVTRVVEDFIEAEVPLDDLDLLADIEQDETKRKFILERKIASLLAQLGRVTRTARFVANASKEQSINVELTQCSEQTELLAPMLVKAAQQRIDNPDDKTVIENYKALLAQYAESISKVRDLCDRSVDPMDFVQTAGDTMQRMREDMSQHNGDPQKCAHSSTAITKLANRVINVSMSSNAVASDPELQKALIEAKSRLNAVTPASTRASRMPDWRDTTAEILRTTGDVESALGGENIFKKEPTTANQPIYSVARSLHESVREWSSKDNEIVGVARRMAVLMARLSEYMETDKTDALIVTSKSIVLEAQEVTELAKKLAHECTDVRIKTNLLQTCERIPTISGQLKMLTAVKAASLGQQGVEEDKEAMDMLVGNAQSLMMSVSDVVKAAASASVKIMSQRGPRLRWVRKNYY